MSLTDKQRLFVEHYLKCLNATQAAREAGYAAKTSNQLAVQGHKNLQNEKIRAEIEQRLKKSIMPAEEVLYRLGRQATLDVADFIDMVDGKPQFNFERARELGITNLIKKVRYNEKSGMIDVEFHDPQRALDLLGKYHKLFTTFDVNLSGKIEMTWEDLMVNGVNDDDDDPFA